MNKLIQKIIDDYNANNPQSVQREKENLMQEVAIFLHNCSSNQESVFDEFPDNPLKNMSQEELSAGIEKLINMANEDSNVLSAAQQLMDHICRWLIYKEFCRMENNLRQKEVNWEETPFYDFILMDIADDIYALKQNSDISTNNLLCYGYYLAHKDYYATLHLPLKHYIEKYIPKKHRIAKRKNSPNYMLVEAEKNFILQDGILSMLYKNFRSMYNGHVLATKFSR